MQIQHHGAGPARRTRCLVSAAVLNLAMSGWAMAQTPQAQRPDGAQDSAAGPLALEEIVVTAERRATGAQKLASSISVKDGGELQVQGKFELGSILENIPGVTGGADNGTGDAGTDSIATGVVIRGIRSNGGSTGQNIAAVPAAAIYVDNVYDGVGSGYDVDRVEVLRGPQGTLYGRSATAGVIAFHTRNPNLGSFSAETLIEGGNYNLRHVNGAVNLPLVEDALAVRISGNHYERDGYESRKGGAIKTDDARIKILARPNDDLSLLAGLALQDNVTHTGGLQVQMVGPSTYSYTERPVVEAKNGFRQVWGELNWDLGAVQLTYIPALRRWSQDAAIIVGGPGGAPLDQVQRTPRDNFVTQELRFSSRADAKLYWQTGLFYYDNDLHSTNVIRWRGSGALVTDADVSRRTKNAGIFAEAVFPLREGLRLTAGLRYDKTKVQTNETYTANLNALIGMGGSAGLPEVNVTAKVSGDQGRREFNNVTYKARLEYDLSARNLLYGAVSTGFLPGDVQITTGMGNQPVVNVYDAETLTSYELGSKNRFLGDTLQVNGSIFLYDYGGYQTNVVVDPTNPGSSKLLSVPMKVVGGELEVVYQVTSNDRTGVNAAYTKSKFYDTPTNFSSSVAQDGMWGTPPTTITAFWEHGFHFSASDVVLRGEVLYRSSYVVQSLSQALVDAGGLPYVQQDEVTLGNASANWLLGNGRYVLTAYVRNLSNQRYKTMAQVQSLAPVIVDGARSDPRTWGVALMAKF